MRRNNLIGLCFVFLVLVLLAVHPVQAEEIKIGLSLPLSGSGAIWGKGAEWWCKKGAQEIREAGGVNVKGIRPLFFLGLLVTLGAYLLLTATVHPWYVTLIAPLLPFLAPRGPRERPMAFVLAAGLYLAAAVPLSYLTYLDPENLMEYPWVRFVEYVPPYLLLLTGLWTARIAASDPDRC